MSRTATVLLAMALLLPGPGLALGADEEEGGRSPSRSEQLDESVSQDQTDRDETGRDETGQIDELPIYVPPQRGSIPTRVGGASRGGLLPG